MTTDKRLIANLQEAEAKVTAVIEVANARLTGSLKNIIVHSLDGVRANVRAAIAAAKGGV